MENEKNPKVSVIVIAYKVERFLTQCLESVVHQTYRNLEIIIVLGSTDEACVRIADTYAAQDDRILLIKEEPKGVAVARNQGIAAATGDYIGFVDGDDWADRDMFEVMVTAAVRHDADISVVGKYNAYVNGNEGIHDNTETVLTEKEAFEQILYQKGFFLHLWDKLYKRRIFEQVRFPVGERVEDRKIGYHLLSMANKIVYNSASKYYFRVSEDSGSRVADNLVLSIKNDYEMCDYVRLKYPELEQAIQYFLVYENMSVIQNNILFGTYDRKTDRQYSGYVRRHARSVLSNPHVDRSIKAKVLLCIFSPKLFGQITVARRERFLKRNISFQTGADWVQTFEKLEKGN